MHIFGIAIPKKLKKIYIGKLLPLPSVSISYFAPLPTGEPVDKLAYEAYPEDYHGPREIWRRRRRR
jgi:hypothetical protein